MISVKNKFCIQIKDIAVIECFLRVIPPII